MIKAREREPPEIMSLPAGKMVQKAREAEPPESTVPGRSADGKSVGGGERASGEGVDAGAAGGISDGEQIDGVIDAAGLVVDAQARLPMYSEPAVMVLADWLKFIPAGASSMR